MLQYERNHKGFTCSSNYLIVEVMDLERGVPFDCGDFVFVDKVFVQKHCGGSCIK
jgi:hypothetical protein